MLPGAESGHPKLVLASTSPRRRELLARLVTDFSVEPADIDESPRADESASDLVVRLATEKAQVVARPGTVVIAADTEVALDGRSLGKPVDAQDAKLMLARLSGRPHQAMTGFAVAHGSQLRSGLVETTVSMRTLSAADIDWYVGTGEPMGKAGAYAIQGQGSVFVEGIEGNHDAVVGLPLAALDVLMAEMGLALRGPFRSGQAAGSVHPDTRPQQTMAARQAQQAQQ